MRASVHVGAAVLLGLLAVGLYAPTFDFPYVFDDHNNVRDNPHIRVERLSWDGLWRAASEGSTTRPVAYVSFALSHRFGGSEPAAHRRVNVAIHALNGILVYLLALRLLALHGGLGGQSAPRSAAGTRAAAALFAAAIFVCHPLQTQAVTYVVQRMASLSALFSLVALLCWLGGRSRVGGPRLALFGAALVSFVLALLTKENAAVLPVVVLAIEWFFFRDLDAGWLRRHAVAIGAASAAAIGLGLWALAVYPYDWARYGFTPVEQALSELRVLWRYMALVALPLPSWQNLSHAVPVSRSLLDPPSTLAAGLGLGLLAAGLAAAARRHRLVAFCGLWFFLMLAIESSFIPIELMYEHRLYLPLFGPALLCAHLLFGFATRRAFAPMAVGLLVVVLLAVATTARNTVWRDEVTLWSDVVSKSPADARAWNNLGSAHEQAGRPDAAVRAFEEAVAQDPGYPRARANLGIALQRAGRLEEALVAYEGALRLEPGDAATWGNRGSVLLALARWQEAADDYRTALRLAPRRATAQHGLAVALARLGQWDLAEAHLLEALRLAPANSDARQLLQTVRQARSLGLGAPAP